MTLRRVNVVLDIVIGAGHRPSSISSHYSTKRLRSSRVRLLEHHGVLNYWLVTHRLSQKASSRTRGNVFMLHLVKHGGTNGYEQGSERAEKKIRELSFLWSKVH